MILNTYLLSPHSIFVLWLMYCLISAPLVYLMMLLIPSRLRPLSMYPFLFFYLLAISIFIFGLLIVLVLIGILHYQHPPKKKSKRLISVDYPDFQQAPKAEMISYGEGSGLKIIKDPHLPKGLRQNILIAINKFESKNVNKINSMALSDNEDEIRLYAHSLIEQQERKLTSIAQKLLQDLAKTENVIYQAYLKKQVAEVLWEQIYKYLVSGEVRVITLKKIKRYAHEALHVFSDDIALSLLLTKIAMQEFNLSEAKQWLKLAISSKAPDYKVLALWAEIEYLEGNYSKIQDILSRIHNKGIFALQPIISFWTTS